MTELKNTAADKSETQESESGVIAHEGILDLTGMKTPADLAHIRAIRHVGVVLVPEELAGELAKILQSHVGAVIPVPTPKSGKLRLMTGQLQLSGDSFAGEECAEDVAVLCGQVIFTSPVQTCRLRGLVVAGQLLAPEQSKRALGSAITRMSGQLIYYPDNAKPRILLGRHEFENAFFKSLAEPVVLLLIGDFTLADDVAAESVREKLAGLVLIGNLTCSSAIKPIIQAMCTECLGNIGAR